MNRWKYEFDCKNCAKVQLLDTGACPAQYCTALAFKGDPLYFPDDVDYVLRCSEYEPKSVQESFF